MLLFNYLSLFFIFATLLSWGKEIEKKKFTNILYRYNKSLITG